MPMVPHYSLGVNYSYIILHGKAPLIALFFFSWNFQEHHQSDEFTPFIDLFWCCLVVPFPKHG